MQEARGRRKIMPLSDDVIARLTNAFYSEFPMIRRDDRTRLLIAELEKTHEIVERRQQDEERRKHQERLLEASLYRLNDIIKRARD